MTRSNSGSTRGAAPVSRITCGARSHGCTGGNRRKIPDLNIPDHVLAGGELGVEFLPRLKARAAHVPIILYSGTLDIPGKLQAFGNGRAAHYVIEKRWTSDELEKTVGNRAHRFGFRGNGFHAPIGRTRPKQRSVRARTFNHRRLARQHKLLLQLRHTSAKPKLRIWAADYRVARKNHHRDCRI